MDDDPDTAGDASNLGLQFLLLFVLILMNAFFAASEIAVISLNDNKLNKMANEGNKKAKQILKLTANSSNFLATIQIGVTLAGFLTSASAASTLSTPLANWFIGIFPSLGTNIRIIQTLSGFVITLITSYFSLVFGELVPKRIAMQKSEKLSFAFIGVLNVIATIFRPFVRFLSFSTNTIVRLFGIDPYADEENMTEEEIRMMVDVGGEKGVIETIQKDMINNVFEFDDINAEDIMTPRMDIESVEVNETLEKAIEIGVEAGYSRLPVYQEDIDNIVGILYVKDLLTYVGKAIPDDLTIRAIMRETFFVPKTKRCGDLFSEMTEKRIQMSIVADEYGGVAGIVSMEDLIESIVGSIQDEYDEEVDDIISINETSYDVDGSINLDELSNSTGIIFPEGDYETLGGFIMDLLGRIPLEEEQAQVRFENLTFTVKNMDERRIERVHIEIEPIVLIEEKNGKDKKDKKKSNGENENDE